MSHSTASLNQEVLYWSSVDRTNLATVVVNQCLDQWSQQNSTKHQRVALDQANEQIVLGLSIWSVEEISQLVATLSALINQRKRSPKTFQLLYITTELTEFREAVLEAGGHLVVHEISQLAKAVEKTLPSYHLSQAGVHPLTVGLISKLPWDLNPSG